MIKSKTRADMKNNILTNLGHPHIVVNLNDAQLDKAINQSLKLFFKYHPHGSFESFYIYTISQDDIDNGYIPVPEWIDAVVEVLPKGLILSDMSFASAEYQLTRDTFMAAQRFTNVSLVDYVTMKQRVYHTELMITPPRSFEFVKYQRRLIPQFKYSLGDTIAMRCYENVEPENDYNNDKYIDAGEVFNDDVLLELATAHAQKIWGNILKKFGNVVLPGGVSLDGTKLYDDAVRDIEKIVRDMMYENPVDFQMG